VLLERAQLLHADRRDVAAAPLLAETAEIFTRLRATPTSNAPSDRRSPTALGEVAQVRSLCH
jgi:hypothetical protein